MNVVFQWHVLSTDILELLMYDFLRKVNQVCVSVCVWRLYVRENEIICFLLSQEVQFITKIRSLKAKKIKSLLILEFVKKSENNYKLLNKINKMQHKMNCTTTFRTRHRLLRTNHRSVCHH